MPVTIIVTLIVVDAFIVLALLVSLVRHVKALGRSVSAFREAVQPAVEEIAADAARVGERMATISESMPNRESTSDPGARIPS